MRPESKDIQSILCKGAIFFGLMACLSIVLTPSCSTRKLTAKDYFDFGNHFVAEGDYVKAQYNFTLAIKLNPYYFEAYAERAKSWEQSDSLDRAIRDYDSLLTFKTLTVSQTADLNFNRANMYYLLSEDTLACKGWRKACDLNHNKSCDVIRKRCK